MSGARALGRTPIPEDCVRNRSALVPAALLCAASLMPTAAASADVGVRAWTDPGALPAMKIAGATEREVPLEHTHVAAVVTGHVARVEVVQRYRNDADDAIEATYTFPLPENAAVDDLRIRVRDLEIVGQVRTPEKARAAYDAARAEGRAAALLEQQRPNIFTQSVANIPPGEHIDVTIRYVQTLTWDRGEYELVFPMVVGPRFAPAGAVADLHAIHPPTVGVGERPGHDISLEVSVDAGRGVIDLDVPTHEIEAYETAEGLLHVAIAGGDTLPNRDFVMRWRLDDGDAGAGASPVALTHRDPDSGEGTATVILYPPPMDVEALVGQRELVFVVDVSGSMSGQPLSLAKGVLQDAVRRMRPTDTFNVITFAAHTGRLFETPQAANDANVKRAFELLDGLTAGGGTHMADAVREALSPDGDPDRHRYVFFVTDGYVGNEARIFAEAGTFRRALVAAGRRARVFGIGVGSSPNRHLVDGLSKAGGGVGIYAGLRGVPTRVVEQFYALVDHPVISGLRFEWEGLDIEPSDVETSGEVLFATHPLIVHARTATPGVGALRVSGTLHTERGTRRFERRIDVDFASGDGRRPVLPALWARARIDRLSRALWDGPSPASEAEITRLGLRYRLVTQFTSFVALGQRVIEGDDGPPRRVEVPIAPCEGTNPIMAGNRMAANGLGSVGSVGMGGLGLMGAGRGGGGVGYGGGSGVLRAGKKSARAPRIIAGHPQIRGSLDKEIIRRVIRRRRAAVRYCYEKQLQRVPGLEGKVVVHFVIQPDGRVSATVRTEHDDDFEAVAACLQKQVVRWRFPAPKGAGAVVVKYPFEFQPAPGAVRVEPGSGAR
jgi:Ca-activated chloride channel family protein